MCSNAVPFASDAELCSDLDIQDINGQSQIVSKSRFSSLPGQPAVSLAKPVVLDFLQREMMTPDLNRMAPHMWLIAKPSSDHCSALHEQIVRNRNIVITENPELHLCWIDHKVFVKPIPRYLLSWAFWQHYMYSDDADPHLNSEARSNLIEAVLGFMRSYYFLVRHESDFRIAIKEHLIPETTKYEDFMMLILNFGNVQDSQVSPRYRFGELRLRRLNQWSRILLGKPYFHKIAWQYADYFAQYYAPYLFVFSIFSVALSAMQVGVSAQTDWQSFFSVSAWFSMATLLVVCVVILWIMGDFIFLGGREVIYARFIPYLPNVDLYYIEYDAACATKWASTTTGATIFTGDQADIPFLEKFKAETGGKFDVIVDDGGHTMKQQKTSLDTLFESIKPSGLYFVEDLQTSYWPDYGAGEDVKTTFVER